MVDISSTNEAKNTIPERTKKKSIFQWKYTHKNVVNKEKKKIIIPKYTKIALINSAVLFVLYIFVKILKGCGIYLYLFGIGSDAIIQLLVTACGVCLISATAVFLLKNSKHKIIVAIILTIVIGYVTFIYSIFFLLTYWGSGCYDEFKSPDKKHTVVMYNTSFLLEGSGLIFEKTSFCTMSYVSGWWTDDGYYPFGRSDSYDIVWNEDNFELHYNNGMGSEKNVHQKIDYIK
ncbi:MAG: hypothetical protein E7574_05055 [Ruminococcaceae bacterium]|nr:hypothetical protein [Oscillospiraceae bacterium]